jgi:hypothetical protein
MHALSSCPLEAAGQGLDRAGRGRTGAAVAARPDAEATADTGRQHEGCGTRRVCGHDETVLHSSIP